MLCNAYTRAIEVADGESNLGCWAEPLEYRIPRLPFNRNPLLWMIRACSHVHDWLSTPVYGHMIYECMCTGLADTGANTQCQPFYVQ